MTKSTTNLAIPAFLKRDKVARSVDTPLSSVPPSGGRKAKVLSDQTGKPAPEPKVTTRFKKPKPAAKNGKARKVPVTKALAAKALANVAKALDGTKLTTDKGKLTLVKRSPLSEVELAALKSTKKPLKDKKGRDLIGKARKAARVAAEKPKAEKGESRAACLYRMLLEGTTIPALEKATAWPRAEVLNYISWYKRPQRSRPALEITRDGDNVSGKQI